MLHLELVPFASQETAKQHRAYCATLGLPELSSAGSPRLAVVGGGPGVTKEVETLRAWDGDIWAVNGAFNWCRENGIDATFMSVDTSDFILGNVQNVQRAILATECSPRVFDALKGRHIETFDPQLGPTSACDAALMAVKIGYDEITLFGCEGSHDDIDRRHAYPEPRIAEMVIEVACGGQRFFTQGDYLRQSEFLASAIRVAPHVFRERSGGLLRALVEYGEWQFVRVIE